MARTNKQESERVKKFTANVVTLIETQGRNVADFDLDQESDKLEELVAHLEGAGGSNATNDAAGTKAEAQGSEKAVSETSSESEPEKAVLDIEAAARTRSDEIIAAAEERAKVIIAEASHHAQRIINDAQDKAGVVDRDTQTVAQVEAVDPADLKEYRNTGKVNLFTEAGRCIPNGKVRLTEVEAGDYPALELLGEDNDPASEVDDSK